MKLDDKGIFADLNDDEKQEFAKIFEEKALQESTTLREEGKKYATAFYLLEGEIGVYKKSSGNETKVTSINDTQDIFFSFTSLIDAKKSLTTLICAKECKIAEVKRGDFFNFCSNNPKAGVKILKKSCEMLSSFLRIGDERLMQMYKTLEEVL